MMFFFHLQCHDRSDEVCWEEEQCLRLTSYIPCAGGGGCLHPSLICDGQPQCPEGEDEEPLACRKEYVAAGRQKAAGTHLCRAASDLPPHIWIRATLCDGEVECEDGSDEKCGQLSRSLLYILVSILSLSLSSLGLASLRLFQPKQIQAPIQ